MNLVFLGSDPIALPLLNHLHDNPPTPLKITALFTQPDRPVGRGQHITPNALKLWALERGIPVHQPEKLTDETRLQLAALAPDLALVMAYGHILRQAFIDTPRHGTLNLHASALPKYRGASPIQTAVANNERQTAVTLMRVIQKLDAGPVADTEPVDIAPTDTALDIEQKLAAACIPLLQRTLPKIPGNTLDFTNQNDPGATYCRRLRKTDATLDFHQPAKTAAARINGLNPWPSVTIHHDKLPLKLTRADTLPNAGTSLADARDKSPSPPSAFPAPPPGTVLGADARGLHIATTDGILRILSLQRPGGKNLPAPEFLRGHPIPPGTLLPSAPQLPLVSGKPFPKIPAM